MTKAYTRCIILFASALISSVNHLAMAAQFCSTTIPATIPDGQLIENGDGTVTDTKTGLMWKQQSETQVLNDGSISDNFALVEVIDRAASSSYAGYTDWRVPNTKELLSLVEWRCVSPAINLHYFPELGDEHHPISYIYDAIDTTLEQVKSVDDDGNETVRINEVDMARVNFSDGSVGASLSYFSDRLRLVRDAN